MSACKIRALRSGAHTRAATCHNGDLARRHPARYGRSLRSIPVVFRMRLAISSMEHSVVSSEGIA